jgi:hypothetical protein
VAWLKNASAAATRNGFESSHRGVQQKRGVASHGAERRQERSDRSAFFFSSRRTVFVFVFLFVVLFV